MNAPFVNAFKQGHRQYSNPVPGTRSNVPRFDSYAAYLREREYSAKLETALAKALDLLSMENSRRKLRGEDVAHLEAFVSEARGIWS